MRKVDHDRHGPCPRTRMLGHATIAITLDTYSHVLPNMQDSAAKAMEEVLSWRVGVVIGVEEGRHVRRSPSLHQKFIEFCRRFTSTGGRARTDTVLSHHRILSPATRVPLCPSVSANSACLRGFSALHARRYTVVFNSVLVRLQYGCSTLLLCEGGVVE